MTRQNRSIQRRREEFRLEGMSRPKVSHHVLSASAGAVSAPVKSMDEETRRLVDEAIARRAAAGESVVAPPSRRRRI